MNNLRQSYPPTPIYLLNSLYWEHLVGRGFGRLGGCWLVHRGVWVGGEAKCLKVAWCQEGGRKSTVLGLELAAGFPRSRATPGTVQKFRTVKWV